MKFDDSIRSVLERKGTEVFSVAPNASVYEALHEMAVRDIGALLVTQVLALVWFWIVSRERT